MLYFQTSWSPIVISHFQAVNFKIISKFQYIISQFRPQMQIQSEAELSLDMIREREDALRQLEVCYFITL